MSYEHLIGRRLLCDRKKPKVRKACARCGSVLFRIETGKGPHALGLRCDGCGGSYKWLSWPAADRISDGDLFLEGEAA